MKIELLIMVSLAVIGKIIVEPILETLNMYNMIYIFWCGTLILSLFILIFAISRNFEEIKKEIDITIYKIKKRN